MLLQKKIIVLAFVASLAACTAPIQNVDHAPIVSTVRGQTYSMAQVRAAIIRAGGALGWEIEDDGPSAMKGTLHLRTHTAVVKIPYTPTSYSIDYVSSVNLKAKDGRIHKNYNGWIQNLTKGINEQLRLTDL